MTSPFEVLREAERTQLDAFVEEYRRAVGAVLRELAHHCGHADILREQVLAG